MRKAVSFFFCFLLLAASGCLGSSGTPAGARPGLTAQDLEAQKHEAMAADTLDKAMQLFHDGEFLDNDAALSYLNEAVRLDPNLASARYQRAVLLMELNRWDEALADVEAILTIKPDHIQARFTQGLIRYHRLDYPGAAKDFSLVLEQDDAISEAFAFRGSCYGKLNRLEDAINDYTRALALNPAHREAYYNRGIARIKLGDDKGAVYDLTQALTLDSQSMDTLMARATVYMRLSNFSGAADDFQRAIVLAPTDSGLQALLGEALAGSGNFSGAEAAANRALILARAEGDDKAAAVYAGLISDYRTKAKAAAKAKAATPAKATPAKATPAKATPTRTEKAKPKPKPEPKPDKQPPPPPGKRP